MFSVNMPNGKISKDHVEILKEQHRFFETLYSANKNT